MVCFGFEEYVPFVAHVSARRVFFLCVLFVFDVFVCVFDAFYVFLMCFMCFLFVFMCFQCVSNKLS